MKAYTVSSFCLVAFLLVFGVGSQAGCATNHTSQVTLSTAQSNTVSKPQSNDQGPLVRKDAAGNTTIFSDYETKTTAPNGKVLWWDIGFGDEGKSFVEIVRNGAGDDIPTHDGIQLIVHRVYRPDGNISEKREFFGNGPLRQRVIYRYSDDGKWLKGDCYDGNGKHTASELTKPEAFMYGDKRKEQQ